MKKTFITLVGMVFIGGLLLMGGEFIRKKSHPEEVYYPWEIDTIRVEKPGQYAALLPYFQPLHQEGWHQLGQVAFWKKIMQLPPDQALVNQPSDRKVILELNMETYSQLSSQAKEKFKDSVRVAKGLPESEKLNVTGGKSHFYRFDLSIPNLLPAMQVFQEAGVDPWYALAILLIESPNQLQASPVGAYGPFQLMPKVARQHGLTVNKEVDEREDLLKSARAAASLISQACLPKARKHIGKFGIKFKEEETWFRLIVLHVYHAGAGNVAGALDKIQPSKGGIPLIATLWKTEYKGFKNASQNYSQVALAAMLLADAYIKEGKIPYTHPKD